MSSTDIEKKNLEAHVELCAERYKSLEDKLDNLDQRVSAIEKKIDSKMQAIESKVEDKFGEIKKAIIDFQEKRNTQLIGWGVSIISTLISILLTLLWKFVVH
jgi:predicted  nucleic acid-binding Zn-ribbon protein